MKIKILYKMIAILMIVLILFSSASKIVYASTEITGSKLIYDKGECERHLQYWKESAGVWSYIICHYVVYNDNGREYPAYCLNQELHGVGEEPAYDVDITEYLNDDRVWRAVTSGYPYKSPAELGVDNEWDAFIATKQAVYCVIYDWDAASRYRGGDERGQRIANAVVNISNEGKYGTRTRYNSGIQINKVGGLQDEGDYISQEYSTDCGENIERYYITAVANMPNGGKTTNMNNAETTEFGGGEHFKVRIPKNQMNGNMEIAIAIQAKARIYPVFYGKTRIAGTQDYALTYDPYGDIVGDTTLNVQANNGKLEVYKSDKDTKDKIQGVTFQLIKKNGEIVGTSTTDSQGMAKFEGLYQGDYILKETSANQNYVLDNTDFEVNVEYNKTTTKEIENEHKKGNVKIYKVDKDNNKVVLGNVQFDLFSHELNKVVGTYTTDINGEIYIENIRTGNYSIIEKNTNKWYNLADNVDIQVKWNETTETKIENELKKGQIKVVKVDKENNEIKLEGVKFNVLDEKNNILETIITDKNGIAYTSKYAVRDFPKLKLQEIETLKNYVLNDEPQVITLEENKLTSKTITNGKIYGNVEVIKTDVEHKEKLSNCEFKVYRDSNENNKLDSEDEFIDNLKEIEKGKYRKEHLEYGKYFIAETKATDGYVISKEVSFNIEKNDVTVKIDLEDKKVEMSKVDIAGAEIEGAKIQVKDKNNKIIDEWVSSKEPHKIQNLVEGGKYILHEEIAANGYVKATDVEFEVTYEKKNQKVTMIDKIVEMSKVDVTGAEIVGAKMQVLDKNNKIVDEWVSSNKPHKIQNLVEGGKYILHEEIAAKGYVKATNIEFEVTYEKKNQKVTMVDKIVEMSKVDVAGAEIVGAKMQVKDKNNKIVDEWESKKEPHKISNLMEGEKYTLHEEIAANGYVKATDIQFEVSFKKENQKIKMIDKIVTMSKKDIAGAEVEGAELKVVDEKGNIVDSWISTKESHNISGLIEGKKYTLYEDYAPEGLVVSNEIEFEVTKEKKDQFIEMIDKRVQISKQDIAGDEIEGATLIVTNTRTKQIVDKWVSGKEPHYVNNLVEGQEYILHEEITAEGYVKATDIKFTVSYDKETEKIVMVDKVVEISKTDLVTKEELEGAKLQVTDEDGNVIDEWVSGKEPHKVVGLEEGKEYTLTEITCPYGYEQAESIKFEVTYDKNTQKIEMKDMPILKNIRLIKLDSSTNEAIVNQNFTFGLYADEECKKLIMQMDSNTEDGTIIFEELRYGDYYIKEITAPKGYQKSDRIVKISINDDGVFADGDLMEENEDVYSFKFFDDLIPEVNTGITLDDSILIALMAMSLMGITTGTVVIIKRKKDKK